MKHITDIPQAAQGTGLTDLIVIVLAAVLIGLLAGSLLASWTMAVVCRTLLRFNSTIGSCFKAYWLAIGASLVCGIVVGLFQAVLFAGVRGKTHELLPLWSMFSAAVLSTLVSVMFYGLKIQDAGNHHLGVARATALVFIHPLMLAGLAVFVLWSVDAVFGLRGMDPPGGLKWLGERAREGFGRW
jgi:hypothetical protein